MKPRIITSVLLAASLVASCGSLAFAEDAQAQTAQATQVAQAAESGAEASSLQSSSSTMSLFASSKNGLVKKGSSYYFYKNGKKVKSCWKKVKGYKYYFQKNGKAATGSVKIKGTYYVFKANGKLAKGTKTRVVTIKKVKYQVTKAGKAKSGWNAKKTRYYKTNGALFTNGKKKIGSKTYCFKTSGALIKGDGIKKISTINYSFLCANSKGIYDSARTKKLNAYASEGTKCQGLISLLGTPSKQVTLSSCYSVGGEECVPSIERTYKNFKLVTYKTSNGEEYFGYLEAV